MRSDISAYLHFRDRFQAAMDPAYYPIDHLDQLILSGGAVLFAEGGAAIVVEIKTFPSGLRALHGLVAAGDLSSIRTLIAHAEAWGRAEGCTRAIIESRLGWERAMRSAGYRAHQISIVKEL